MRSGNNFTLIDCSNFSQEETTRTMNRHINSSSTRTVLRIGIAVCLIVVIQIPSSFSFRLTAPGIKEQRRISWDEINQCEKNDPIRVLYTKRGWVRSSRRMLLPSSYEEEEDDELGLQRLDDEDWTEEDHQSSNKQEEAGAMRNILNRFWSRKGSEDVRLIPPPPPLGGNKQQHQQQLPQWLKDQQDERKRIRQLEKQQKKAQQQEQLSEQKTLSTTGNIQNLMKGMPSLDELFGDESPPKNERQDLDQNDTIQDVTSMEDDDDEDEHRKEEEQQELLPSNNSLEVTSFDAKDEDEDVGSTETANFPRLSVENIMSRENLGQRMQLLLQEAGGVNSQKSFYNYSAAVEAAAVEAAANSNMENNSSSTSDKAISAQRYRSFRKIDDNITSTNIKRNQFEHFLQQEQQLRQKMGLTGSLFEKEQQEKVEWNLEQEEKQQRQQHQHDEKLIEKEKLNANITEEANIVVSEPKAKIVFDEYGTDPSFMEWKQPRSTTIEDARYRSFSPANASKESKGAFEMFLKKEKEMREKMGLKKVEEVIERTADVSSSKWSEVEKLYAEEHSGDQEDDYLEEEDSINYYEEEGYEDEIDKYKPKPMSIADQRFRSFAANETSPDYVVEDKKAEFKAFLKKEQQLRQKLGYDSSNSYGEADVIVDEDDEVMNPHPHSPYYDEDETEKNQIRQAYYDETIDQVDEGERSLKADEQPISSKWSELEKLYSTEHNSDYDDVTNENDLKYSETPYDNIASELFNRGNYMNDRVRMERTTSFTSFEARRKDLLENTELTVAELNLLYEFDPLLRLSTINKPDSAFGAIFRFEGCLVDTTELQMQAWSNTAKMYQFRLPDREEVGRAMLMKPEVAVRDEFYWTTDILESREVALTHHDKLQESFDEFMEQINVTKVETTVNDDPSSSYYLQNFAINRNNVRYNIENMNVTASSLLFPVAEGAQRWLHNIREVDMPCSVISHLDSTKLEALLNITGLSECFDPEQRVSSCAGYTREEQECLGSSLRMRRRPDHCVVFGSTPDSSIKAHEVEIKSVSIMGLYPMYELRAADLTVASFDDLSVVNIRRLFSDKSFEPEVQLMLERPLAKPLAVRTWIEGDRN